MQVQAVSYCHAFPNFKRCHRNAEINAVAYVSPMRPNLQTVKQHSMPPEKRELFKHLEGWASNTILPILKPVEKCWQPQEFLPLSSLPVDQFTDEVRSLRERVADLSDDLFVVLVGDMITEEALPTYQTMINTLDGVKDETGASDSPWAMWTRMWTAEENRHGDLLSKYLYLSGRVDMKMVDRTIQYLIGSGMDPGTENNPYLGFVYTSFQERATFISHGNTARLAKTCGDSTLAQICGTIAADEKRHELAYGSIVSKLLELDPNGAILAIEDMMRKKITMPGHLMHDGRDSHIFDHFSTVAQRLGVYTAKDYAGIVEFLVEKWGLEKMEELDGDGRKAQDYICRLGQRIRKLQERAEDKAAKCTDTRKVKLSWIFDRELEL